MNGTGKASTDIQNSGNENSPVMMRCKSCSAPLQFDILKQNRKCLYCGTVTSVAESIAERKGWQSSHRMKIASEAAVQGNVFYNCDNCGSRVVIREGHAVGKCEFCGGRLVRRSYANHYVLPDIIIPFFITQEEALEQIDKWCAENPGRPEAGIIRNNKDKLTGMYLPFQMVKGAADADVLRAGCFRHYSCSSYLDGIAINTSKHLSNLLLDAAEPFDFDRAREFDFTYLEDYMVKLQDIDEKDLRVRVINEVTHDYALSLNKQFGTDKVDISTRTDDLLIMSAVLPFYLIDCGKVKLAMNAQTGRVAVTKEKVRKSYRHLLEPTLITSAIFIAISSFLIWTGAFTSILEAAGYAALLTLVMGMITFAAYTQNRRGAAYEDPVLYSKPSAAVRNNGKLSIAESTAEKERPEPVFYENLKKSGITPVALRFYDKARIIKWLLWFVLLNFSPWILGSIIGGFDFSLKRLAATLVWLIISVPVTIAMAMQQGRILVYDHPIIYYYPYEGREIPKDEYREARDFKPTDIFAGQGNGCMMLGLKAFLVLLYIGSIVSAAAVR